MGETRPQEGTAKRGDSLRVATASRALPLIAGYGLNLLATPITASSLGLVQFGLWALTGAFAQYGSLLDLGVSRSVTRFTALHLAQGDQRAADKVVSTAGTLVLGMAVPLTLIGLLAAAPLAELVEFRDVGTVRAVISASLLILVTGQLCTVLTGAAFGREIQALPNTVITVCGVLGTCISTTAAVLTEDVVVYAWSAAVWNTVTLVAIALTVHVRVARLRVTRPSRRTLRELASFGVKGQSLLLAELIVFQASKVLLGAVSGTAAAGAYELGSRLALGFRTLGALFTGALTAPLTRSFSERGIRGTKAEADRLTTRVAALAIVPPLLGAALALPFLNLWLGDHADLTLATMAALCVGFAANMLTGIQQVVAEAIGRPGLSARSAGLTAVLSVVFGVALLLTVGPIGLVLGTGAALVIGSVYNTALVQPAVGSTQQHYYRLVAGPCLLGVLAAGAALLSTLWLTQDDRLEAAVAVAVGTTVFLLVYLPAAALRGYLPRQWFRRWSR
ncbi:lipopolysaccharide biosynthesis protein [Geodermatophilus sp. SYSU D00867]